MPVTAGTLRPLREEQLKRIERDLPTCHVMNVGTATLGAMIEEIRAHRQEREERVEESQRQPEPPAQPAQEPQSEEPSFSNFRVQKVDADGNPVGEPFEVTGPFVTLEFAERLGRIETDLESLQRAVTGLHQS